MENAVVVREPLTAVQIKAQVQLIQEVMKAVMEKDVHYGVIPGTQKPTLYKPGSEKILSTFRIAAYPKEIEDLSTSDEIRYRVKVHGLSLDGYETYGVGIGECSSDEEKYKWRKPVCDQEYDETPEDRRRNVWKKYDGKPYQQKQIRTNPADVANTILKMAKKRAQIDMTLTATAASDVFDQDLEDMSPEIREQVTKTNGAAKPPIQPPQKKEPEDGKISDAQKKRFYAIAKGSGKEDAEIKTYLKETFDITSTADIPRDKYDTAVEWAGAREVGAEG